MSLGRVIVCENDATARRIIGTVLAQHDLEVIAEIDVIPPLADLVKYGRPDVLVLDLVLSGMAGPEGLADLPALASSVSVVVFSAYDELREEALAQGACAFVDKLTSSVSGKSCPMWSLDRGPEMAPSVAAH